MTPREFRQEQDFNFDHFIELTSTGIKPNYVNIELFAHEYHRRKLKLLDIAYVSKCANDIIKYIENDAEIAMPVNELMHESGRHLTKKEYGHVLLKYLIQELRERFC